MLYKISLFYFLNLLFCFSNTNLVKKRSLERSLKNHNYMCLELQKIINLDNAPIVKECNTLPRMEKITDINENNYWNALCYLLNNTFDSACKITSSSKTLPNIEHTKIKSVCVTLKQFLSRDTDTFFYKWLSDTDHCSKLCTDKFKGNVIEICALASYMANLTLINEVVTVKYTESNEPSNSKAKENLSNLVNNDNKEGQSPKVNTQGVSPKGTSDEVSPKSNSEDVSSKGHTVGVSLKLDDKKENTVKNSITTSTVPPVKSAISNPEGLNQPILEEAKQIDIKPNTDAHGNDNIDQSKIPIINVNTFGTTGNQEENIPDKKKSEETIVQDDIYQKPAELSSTPVGNNLNVPLDESGDPDQFEVEEESEDEKPKLEEKSKPLETNEDNISYPASYPVEEDDSYFFSYFMLVCIIFILGYVGYHNKQKILALVLEGRRGKRENRRRPNSANYHKLDCNLEEAVTSSCNKNTTNVIY